eukprot:6187764-Pleurochrysis_carterae.AAC.1
MVVGRVFPKVYMQRYETQEERGRCVTVIVAPLSGRSAMLVLGRGSVKITWPMVLRAVTVTSALL